MTEHTDATLVLAKRPIQCPHCGYYCSPEAATCGKCGGSLLPDSKIITNVLDRAPVILPIKGQGQTDFLSQHSIMIQVLPSGSCKQFPLEKPLTLGRIPIGATAPEDFFDLQGFHADRHGVSRQHCRLERRDDRLIVIDLNSTNGAHLNSKRLTPNEATPVAHGDKLILGSLHLIVFYCSVRGE